MVKGDTPAQDRIKQDEFEKLCGMWCTEKEISSFFEVNEDTLNTWCKKVYGMTFSDTYKIKCTKGNISLRQAQFKSAMKGSVPMQIWLGKQQLGQKDTIEYSGEDNGILGKLTEALIDAKTK